MIDGINQIDKKNNCVVEGPSDFYYLTAFSRFIGKKDINFIYGGGAGNMPKVGTILQGWGCKVIYLYDNDKAYKQAEKNIRKEWITITKDIISKLEVDGSIEDILSKSDYIKYVIKKDLKKFDTKNSEYAKSKNRDKVIDAKSFLDTINNENIKLNDASKKNINDLLKHLAEKFNYLN